MVNRYYATDCKVKPNSDKDIKVIREEDFNKILTEIEYELSTCFTGLTKDTEYEHGLSDAIKIFTNNLEVKDCFGDEE